MLREGNTIFSFERGAYFAGMLEYTIQENVDCMIFNSRSSNDFWGMKDYQFSMPKSAIAGIELALTETLEWDREYVYPHEILDGYGWHIYFNYDGMNISTEGYGAYPPDYRRVIRSIQSEIEKLCKEYAVDYSADRIEERMAL